MKQLLKLCSVLAIAGSFLAGCAEPPSAVEGPEFQMGNGKGGGGGGSTPSANPELCYQGAVPVKRARDGATLQAVFVMNADGSNKTAVYTVANSNFLIGGSPTWSGDGNSVVFTQLGNGTTIPDTIKAVDVSVNANGQVVGSNVRAIYGLNTTSTRLKNPFWSNTSLNMIGFTTDNATTNTVWVISASGGSPTAVASTNETWVNHANPMGQPTWNGDDSKLAMIRLSNNGSYETTIMIFNTTTWEYIDSIKIAGVIDGMDWSRGTTLDKIALGLWNSSGTSNSIHYVDPTTGATPTTNGVAGIYPAWSPDNSSLVYTAGAPYYGPAYNMQAFGTTTSLVSSGSFLSVKWK